VAAQAAQESTLLNGITSLPDRPELVSPLTGAQSLEPSFLPGFEHPHQCSIGLRCRNSWLRHSNPSSLPVGAARGGSYSFLRFTGQPPQPLHSQRQSGILSKRLIGHITGPTVAFEAELPT
jgi:hypothetical protein